MTFLTELNLDTATVVRLRIHDTYDWHGRAWQCFPGRDGDTRDFLTRLDHKRSTFRLTIVSPVEPTRPDWCPPECWRGPKSIPENFFTHRQYRFQLRANPTKKVKVVGIDGQPKKNGQRVPITDRAELVAWLQRKGKCEPVATTGGFVVDEESLRILPGGRESFSIPKKGFQGTHSSVDFEGVLEVTDGRRFYETFARGIGSAKAFGFGLLVIAPIGSTGD